MDNHNKISILIWNAQSIRNKCLETSNFLNSNNITICLVTETWLKHSDSFSLNNYTIYRNDRFEKKPNNRNNGGGVAIGIRNDIQHTQLPHLKTKIIESVGIKVSGIHIYSVYFPGSRLSPDKLTNFKNDLVKLTSSRRSYFLGGDLNAKHRFWNCVKGNKAGNILYNEMLTRNLTIHHSMTPTFFPPQANKSRPSTIDFAISDGLHLIHNIHTINALSSDHVPVLFEVETSMALQSKSLLKRNYSKANWRTFRESIESNISNNEMHPHSLQTRPLINTAIRNLTSYINEAEDIAIPLQKVRMNSVTLDPETLSLISIRNCLRRQAQRTSSPSIKKQVNFLNRHITYRVRIHKNKILQQKLAQIPKNSNQLWKFTKLITNKSKKIPPLKNSSNQLILTDLDKAEEIAKIFNQAHSTTFNDLSDNQTENAVSGSTLLISYLKPEIIETCLPTTKEIKQIINKAKKNKSPGPDQITNLLLKNLPHAAIVFIMHIFIACINSSYFPDDWKHAKVIPIPKSGKDLCLATSYRPISLLNSLSKIFEKAIVKRIKDHLCANDILPNEQFGFRNDHSTNHQLLRVSKMIKNSLSKKESTGLLTFDIEKAFDSVWHGALLYKMLKQKFPMYLIKLIQSFLSNRSFAVSIQGASSRKYKILAGVPQGSVLSPTLYNLFTSDLNFSKCEKGMFADDTTIQFSSKNPTKIVKNLNLACKELSNYSTKWKIKLNHGKTKAAFFTRRKALKWYPTEKVCALNSKIPWDNSIKTLGLTFDKTLTFKKHVDLTVDKALKLLAMLYPLLNHKSKLNQTNKLTVFKAIIRSTLLYACPVWNDCAEVHLNKLQLIQNKCLKIIFNLPRNHPTHDLHRIAKVATIKDHVNKITQNFRKKLPLSENQLIRSLK